MVKLTIAQVAQSQGINSSYALESALGVTARTAVRLWRGDMASISLQMIERICAKLHCQPQDFIKYTPEEKKKSRKK